MGQCVSNNTKAEQELKNSTSLLMNKVDQIEEDESEITGKLMKNINEFISQSEMMIGYRSVQEEHIQELLLMNKEIFKLKISNEITQSEIPYCEQSDSEKIKQSEKDGSFCMSNPRNEGIFIKSPSLFDLQKDFVSVSNSPRFFYQPESRRTRDKDLKSNLKGILKKDQKNLIRNKRVSFNFTAFYDSGSNKPVDQNSNQSGFVLNYE